MCGFTLLEVMVAMVILGVGLLGIYSAIARSIQVNGNNKRLMAATEIAHKQLALGTMRLASEMVAESGKTGLFSWETTFTSKSHGLMLVTVVVTWEQQGRLQTLSRSQVFYPVQEQEET
jgi:prepilin-type N-terminal cleavage/methylation domain-containing protein